MKTQNLLSVSTESGVAIVHTNKRELLDRSDYDCWEGELDQVYEQCQQKDVRTIVLSFKDVTLISSLFMHALIVLQKKMTSNGLQLVLCCLSPEIFEVFVITRLNHFFLIADDEQQALRRLQD